MRDLKKKNVTMVGDSRETEAGQKCYFSRVCLLLAVFFLTLKKIPFLLQFTLLWNCLNTRGAVYT